VAASLGAQAPAASQNDMHYAYFPAAGRLAVKVQRQRQCLRHQRPPILPASPRQQSRPVRPWSFSTGTAASASPPASGERPQQPHGHSAAAQAELKTSAAVCRSIQALHHRTRRPAGQAVPNGLRHLWSVLGEHAERQSSPRTKFTAKRPKLLSRLSGTTRPHQGKRLAIGHARSLPEVSRLSASMRGSRPVTALLSL